MGFETRTSRRRRRNPRLHVQRTIRKQCSRVPLRQKNCHNNNNTNSNIIMMNSKFVSSIVVGLPLATAGASAKSNHGIPTAHPVAHHVAQVCEILGAAEAVGGAAATTF